MSDNQTTPSLPRVRRIDGRLYVTIRNVEYGMSDLEGEALFLALWREFQPGEMLDSLSGTLPNRPANTRKCPLPRLSPGLP